MARVFRQTGPQPVVKPAPKATPETQERTKLAASGLVQKFVRDKSGAWNHQDWLGFLSALRGAGYRLVPDNQVGLLLEEEKSRFWAARK